MYHSPAKCAEAVDSILRELRLQYIDMVLIHWPQGYCEKTPLPKGQIVPKVKRRAHLALTIAYLLTMCRTLTATCCMRIPTMQTRGRLCRCACCMRRVGRALVQQHLACVQAAVEAGKVHSIGVSNFNHKQVQRLLDLGGKVPLSNVQVIRA